MRVFDEMRVRDDGTRWDRKMSAGFAGIAGTDDEGPGVVEGWNEERRLAISSRLTVAESPARVAILKPDARVNSPAFAVAGRRDISVSLKNSRRDCAQERVTDARRRGWS